MLKEELRSREESLETSLARLSPPRTAEEVQRMILDAMRSSNVVVKITQEQREKLRQWIPQTNSDLKEAEEYLFRTIRTNKVSLEIIIDKLNEQGIYCHDERAIRLLLLKLNETLPQPIVLNLPNHYPPHTPLYVELSDDEPLPPEVAALLQHFNC